MRMRHDSAWCPCFELEQVRRWNIERIRLPQGIADSPGCSGAALLLAPDFEFFKWVN